MPRKAGMILVLFSIISVAVWADIRGAAIPSLKNGGFEETNAQKTTLPAEWNISGSGVKIVKDNPRSGKYCLRLEASKGEYAGVSQTEALGLSPDTYYKLTFFYRTQGVFDDLAILVNVFSKTGNIPESVCLLRGAPTWQEGRIVFYSGQGTSATLNITAGSENSAAEVWFDDVALAEMSEADFQSSLLMDGGFEAGEIGMTPIGWTRGWFDDPKVKDRYARCGVDGTEAHTGKRSLRIDFPQNGYFTLVSDARIILPEIPYTFSFWAKANEDGFPLRVTARGPVFLEKHCLVSREWRKYELTFTIPKDKLAASDAKVVQVTFGWEEKNRPAAVLWLDEAAWEIESQEDAEGQGENFLPNGSFEYAENPSFPDFWGCYADASLVPFYQTQTRDNQTAVEGLWSHKVKARLIDFMGAKTFRGSEIEVYFTVPAVTASTDYVLSAYLKSERKETQVSLYASSGEKTFVTKAKLTNQWKRYTVAAPLDGKSPRGDNGGTKVSVAIWPESEGTYWIDAVQFEKGAEPTSYREAKASSANYRLISVPDVPGESEFPAVEAFLAEYEPRLDGKINDPIWKQAAHVSNFVLNREGAPATQQTESWLVFSPTALWVAFQCRDDRIKQIQAEVREPDGPVWRDDCVELFINPTNNPQTFFQFALNTLNTQFCQKWGNDIDTETWDCHWQSAIYKGKDFWSAELRIPLAALELEQKLPDTWRINFCRENHKAGEYSQWSWTQGGFLTPAQFGRLTGIRPDWFSKFFWRITNGELQYLVPLASRFNLVFALVNLTGQSRDVIVATALTERNSDGKPGRRLQLKERAFTIEAGKSLSLSDEIEFDQAASQKYRLEVRVQEKQSGAVLYQGRDYLSVPDFFTAYFQRSFYMNEPTAILQVDLSGCSESLLKQLTVNLYIEGPSGAIIKKTTGFSQGPKAQIRVDLSGLPEGTYPATIEVTGHSGTPISVKKDRLIKLPFKPYAVPVDRETRTILVDGEPYLPYFMGIGAAHLSRNMIPEIAAAGFNGIIGTFNVFSGDIMASDQEIRLFLDDCRQYGLKFIWWFRGNSSGGLEALTEKTLQVMGRVIPKFRDDPAIIAWKVADEWWDEELSGRLYRRCHELDPHRPAYINIVDIKDISRWRTVSDFYTDIESTDSYPFGWLNPLADIEGITQMADNLMRLADRGRMPGYFWLQGGFGYGQEKMYREPTAAEQEALVYLLKIHGFTGFYYFFHRPNARDNWEAMSRLSQELKSVVDPILLKADPRKQLRLFQPNIHATLVRRQGEIYLLVAHAAPGACRFRIPLSAWGEVVTDGRRASALFEEREVTVEKGALSDSFAGYGRRVYLIKN